MSTHDEKNMAEVKAFDLNAPSVVDKCAYVRLTPELKEFLEKCHAKHGIAGFTWDPAEPFNFGVYVK